MEKIKILDKKRVETVGVGQMHSNVIAMLDSSKQETEKMENKEQFLSVARKEEYYDKMKYKKTSLYVSRNLHKELKSYCVQQDITITEAINKAIALFLSR